MQLGTECIDSIGMLDEDSSAVTLAERTLNIVSMAQRALNPRQRFQYLAQNEALGAMADEIVGAEPRQDLRVLCDAVSVIHKAIEATAQAKGFGPPKWTEKAAVVEVCGRWALATKNSAPYRLKTGERVRLLLTRGKKSESVEDRIRWLYDAGTKDVVKVVLETTSPKATDASVRNKTYMLTTAITDIAVALGVFEAGVQPVWKREREVASTIAEFSREGARKPTVNEEELIGAVYAIMLSSKYTVAENLWWLGYLLSMMRTQKTLNHLAKIPRDGDLAVNKYGLPQEAVVAFQIAEEFGTAKFDRSSNIGEWIHAEPESDTSPVSKRFQRVGKKLGVEECLVRDILLLFQNEEIMPPDILVPARTVLNYIHSNKERYEYDPKQH